MKKSVNRKFNKPKGKTTNFPIPQYRCIIRKSHSIYSGAKCSFKIKTILSQQEELMLIGLRNTFSVDFRDVIRIAIAEVFTITKENVENTLPYCKAESDKQGHTARTRKYDFRISKQDKETFTNLSKIYNLSEQETVRLVIIHLEKGIRSETITKIKDARMLTQGQAADAYFENNPVSTGKLNKLKAARDAAKEEKIEAQEELYSRRGEMIDHLLEMGENIPRDTDGDIDLDYIDRKLAEEAEQCLDFAFEEYLETQLRDKVFHDERELRIEKEIFRAEICGLVLTRQEAIEIIEEEDRYEEESKEGLSEEEENEVWEFIDELKRMNEEEDKKEGINRSKQFLDIKIGGRRMSKISDAELKAQEKRRNRIVDHGFTPEERQQMAIDYVLHNKRSAEINAKLAENDPHTKQYEEWIKRWEEQKSKDKKPESTDKD